MPTTENVLGILSLITWSLIVVVGIKYLMLALSADNRGEGGILALTMLVTGPLAKATPYRGVVVAVGLFAAALLYGDGMITPAISVLSAVEGLEVAAPALAPYVVPIAVVLLALLFLAQKQGTAAMGFVFGPVTLVWFLVMALMALPWVASTPIVLTALSPVPAVSFFVRNGSTGFLVLGSVFLVVTGAEALYADMGHFGAAPIRRAWYGVVLPGLLINYFGQGALLIRQPQAIGNPFYLLAPSWALYPLIGLATAATVIASQAVISGAFSLTRQALQLGYWPRTEIVHTSEGQVGQVYVPAVNLMLFLATTALVLIFGSSENLAGAYGVAVSSTMVVTTILLMMCARGNWAWTLYAVLGVGAALLVGDLAYFAANMFKVVQGGWIPLGVAGLVYLAMTTWKRGREVLDRRLHDGDLPVDYLIDEIADHDVPRVPGTAVYLTSQTSGVPHALLHNLKHNKIVHENIILLTIDHEEIPRVKRGKHIEILEVGPGFHRIIAHYGFMESPKVPAILRQARAQGLEEASGDTTYFLARENVRWRRSRLMSRPRSAVFSFLLRNAQQATLHYGIPPNQVVELGEQVTL